MARKMLAYEVPDEVLTFLIGASVSGTTERQLAAKFLLECLRRSHTREEIELMLEDLNRQSLLNVAPEAKRLASMVGLTEDDPS